MNMMNFNYSTSTISLLTCMFLSLFSEAGITAMPELENEHTTLDNILFSTLNLKIAQNDTQTTTDLETEIIAQINRARENPSDYADWLEEQKQYYDGVMLKLPGEKPVRTNRGLQVLEEAINFVRQQTPLAPLAYSEVMAITAQEQLAPLNTDTENQADLSSQNISYGKVTAEAIVMQLVVDDRFRDRRNRLAIFNKDNQKAGVSCQADNVYEQICAIAYAGNPEDIVVNPVSEDVVVTEDAPPKLVTESPSENTVESATEIPSDIEKTITQEANQEAITVPESSPTENITESEIEDENLTPAALNNQPDNFPLIDKVERGFLEEGDKVIPNDGSLYDSYPISGKAGELFIISLESADFDTFLAIMDEEGNVLEQNDDLGEDDSNSQLRVTIPRDGTYSLIINAYDQGGKGAYILTIRRNRTSPLVNGEGVPRE